MLSSHMSRQSVTETNQLKISPHERNAKQIVQSSAKHQKKIEFQPKNQREKTSCSHNHSQKPLHLYYAEDNRIEIFSKNFNQKKN